MDNRRRKELEAERPLRPIVDRLNRVHEEPDPRDANYSSKMGAFELQRCYQTVFRSYVDSWLDANKNFNKWSARNPELSGKFEKFMRGHEWRLESDPTGRAVIKTVLTGTTALDLAGPEIRAKIDFVKVITSLLYDRIGKCVRCNRYYIAGSLHKTKYYSRQCATGATAAESTRKRLRRERNEKIQRTRKAIQEFKRLKCSPQNWKVWVAERANVSPKWITRALNRSELPNARTLSMETKE